MKAIKWLNRHVEEVLLIAMLVVMLVIMIAQVIMRRVIGSSLSWAEELIRYLFVWSGFVSISFTIQNQSAMRLTVLVDALPRMMRNIAVTLVYGGMLLFFGYMTVVAFVQLGSIHSTSAALGIPMFYIYLAPLVGFALSTVRCIQSLVVMFRDCVHPQADNHSSEEHVDERSMK